MSHEDLHASVLETAEGLLFEEFQAAPARGAEDPLLWARITISSPISGDLVVAATEVVAGRFAETLFGEDLPGESSATGLDLLAEFANTIAGSFARRTSEDAPLALSPPEKERSVPPRDFEWTRFTAGESSFLVGFRPERA